MQKLSIRFFDNQEVRVVWDDSTNQWWFAAVDIVAVLSNSQDPKNY